MHQHVVGMDLMHGGNNTKESNELLYLGHWNKKIVNHSNAEQAIGM